ncbi:MAG: guanylate kinase [candidate division Zixibacteria bacterium]|nr:guanylate kinase [candidate division Zixibacteria bacterium]
MKKVNKRGLLIVLSSPSGGGKTTVYKELLKNHQEYFYSVSATTRPKRTGESDGKSYHFLDRKMFQQQIDEGLFAEWAEVYGNYYGTYRDFIDDALEDGRIVLMDIDTQGASNLADMYKEAVTIFILPPSLEILKERLLNRGTDDSEIREERLSKAKNEIAQWRNYKYIVVNNRLEEVIRQVEAILIAETLKTSTYSADYFNKIL